MCRECLGGCPSKGQRQERRHWCCQSAYLLFGTVTPHLGYEPNGIGVEWYSHREEQSTKTPWIWRSVAFLQQYEKRLKPGETDIGTEIGIAWIARLSRLANIADDIEDCWLSSGDRFYELIRTVFGATPHNRHARQHTPRTSFTPNFFDNEESAKQKAKRCVYAKMAKRMRYWQSHYLCCAPFSWK